METTVIKSDNLAEVEISYKNPVKVADRKKIHSAVDAYRILNSVWNMDNIEHVESAVVLLLNRNSDVLGWAKISVGGVAGTVVDKKVIFQLALNANASAIILSHNHPSGNLKASNEDLAITKDIKAAGKLLDINLLDHIIITSEGYFSMAEEGMM